MIFQKDHQSVVIQALFKTYIKKHDTYCLRCKKKNR